MASVDGGMTFVELVALTGPNRSYVGLSIDSTSDRNDCAKPKALRHIAPHLPADRAEPRLFAQAHPAELSLVQHDETSFRDLGLQVVLKAPRETRFTSESLATREFRSQVFT